MRIRDLYRSGHLAVSIEIFPPKTTQGDATLLNTLERLARFRPGFISCTYGAGGTTRERTIELCVQIQEKYHVTATAHLSCVGATREQLAQWVAEAVAVGIRNVMALRGDPPQGERVFRPVPGGLAHANELVALIRAAYPDLGIGVAGYPETHKEAPDPQTDLENLKRKVEAGADAVFTQLFYVNERFFEFRERYERAGISVPLIPGIMPITEFSRIRRISDLCGAQFPEKLARRLEANQHDRAAQFEIGVEHAIEQCRELVEAGVPGIHFYVLNRSRACERILEALGVGPTGEQTPTE
ncbi:MAG: methylenetetrahydrofolate reductase [NAD(P)H] [Planctomycetes bacterium]|nr:methylenetetrahydrofolate reductase [NAD(P)H] [Planctomycetota bacterium]